MACGLDYSSLLRTSEGHTPDDPWDYFPGYGDYYRWLVVVENADAELSRKHDWYEKTLAQAQTEGRDPHPREEEIESRLESYRNELDRLPGKARYATLALPWAHEDHVNAEIRIAREATCIMELVDEVVAHYTGLEPRNTWKKGPPDDGGSVVAVVVGSIAVLGVAFGTAVYFQRKRKSASSAEAA